MDQKDNKTFTEFLNALLNKKTNSIQSGNPWNIQISSEDGYIIEYEASKLTPLVIHIQEAYANLSAQMNISKILRHLIERYQVRLVCAEGGERGYDGSLFDIQDPSLKEKVARYFLERAQLKGAEYEWLLHLSPGASYKTSFTLWGVEDDNLYQDNWNVWKKTQSKQGRLIWIAEQILQKVQIEYRSQASKRLIQDEQIAEDFRRGIISLKDYLGQIIPLIEKNQINIKAYPNVQKLIQIYLGTHSGTLSLGLTSVEELDHLEQKIRLKLTESPVEKEYVKKSWLAKLFVRFIKMELTPAEWRIYQSESPSWESYIQREYQVDLADLEPFSQFYKLANQRSQVLCENALSKMKQLRLDRVVLIAGGFHSYRIINQLRIRKLPFLVIAPKVEVPTIPEDYMKAMHGETLTEEGIRRVIEMFKNPTKDAS